MCVKIRSCRTWRPLPSSSPAAARPGGNGTVQVTAPAETAGLIDRLRASGAVLIYDPETRTIRTTGSDPVAVTAGKGR